MIDLLPIIAFGFVLGMRHATDADHVIAVATIVSRESSIRGAALIGATWGIGHTLTILAVGGAIILLDLTIPPRVGLMMEFAVAVMVDPAHDSDPASVRQCTRNSLSEPSTDPITPVVKLDATAVSYGYAAPCVVIVPPLFCTYNSRAEVLALNV